MSLVAREQQPAWSQAEWLARCRTGDRHAWRWLYQRHFPRVYGLVLRLGIPDREAADVCQEVFLRVYRGLGRFRGDAQVATWIYRITLNEVARTGRASRVRRALAALLGGAPVEAVATTPERQLQQAEAVRELGAVLDHLKPKLRAVFVLFELEELSLEETAAVVGAGLETVKSRLRQARAEFDRVRRQRSLVAWLPGGQP